MARNPKFFYVEDDTAAFLTANGAALTALLVGLPEILPLLDFSVPTYPMWLYFGGLITAFIAKSVIQLQNEDLRQREKLQHGRDWIMEARGNPEATAEFHEQLDSLWGALSQQHGKLLKEHHGPILNLIRALAYLASGLCFLAATASVIYLAGYAKFPGA